MGKRIDAQDTVEVALHLLVKMAAEGWGVADVDCHIEYASPKPGGPRLPVESVVVVRLLPSRR